MRRYNFIMKKSLLYIGVASVVLSLGFSSCGDDFLETESKTDLNTGTGYSTVETADMALVGCYDGLQQTISSIGAYGFYLASEIASDECFAGAGVGDPKNQSILDLFDMSPAPSYTSVLEPEWKLYYSGIFRCNSLISREDVINWDGDDVAKGRIIGEARGIRGFLYFDLARMFGGVPLLLEPTQENLPRAQASEVFEAILADFKFAYENIPADAYNGSNLNSTDGRMSKFAAAALLARAYMFYSGYYGVEPSTVTKDYVVAALKDVKDNGQYAVETLYKDLWMPASVEIADDSYSWAVDTYKGKHYDGTSWVGDISKEIVFNIKANSTSTYNGDADGNGFQVFLGQRIAAHPPYAEGWGICTVNPEFASEFASDPRYKASVIDYSTCGVSTDAKILEGSYEFTGFAIKKYAPLCFFDGKRETIAFELGAMHMIITHYLDFTSVRYTDVLLMLAELTDGADGWSDYVAAPRNATIADLSYSTDNLRTQRKFEFAFEGIRYWDILRYEKDGAYAANALAKQNGVAVKNAGVGATISFDVANFNSKKGLFQIPVNQITLSGNVITQNPGW